MSRTVLAASAAVVVALVAGSALGQTKATPTPPSPATPSKPAAQAPAGEAPKDVLKGPAVTSAAAKPTLVQRDFAGKVVRLEVQPAEAAVKLLTLDDATRAKVDAILLERSKLLDTIVMDNLELLTNLQGARQIGNTAESRRLLKELTEKAAPLRDRGVLAQELIGVLPADQGAELKRLIQEYWKAVVDEDLATSADEKMKDGGADGGGVGGRRAERRDRMDANREEVLRVVGVELKRSYERTVGAASRDFDALLRDLNATPEQESKIRKLVGDSFNKTYGKATPQERARVFWQVYALLDAEQQKTLISRISAKGHGAAPAVK